MPRLETAASRLMYGRVRTFSIPAAHNARRSVPRPMHRRGAVEKQEQRRAVLCAVADSRLRESLEKALSGYDAVFAANGFEALRALNRGFFHAHVLEYWLPDWSGLKLCKHIRKTDPRVPVIVCSIVDRDEDRARAFRAHASAYFTTPIDGAALARKLQFLVELGEIESRRALADAQRVVDFEIRSRVASTKLPVQAVRKSFGPAIERAARVKALGEFLKAGGTLAHFEAAWKPDLSAAWARIEAAGSPG